MFAELRLRTGTNYATATVLRNVKNLAFDEKYNDVGAISVSLSKDDVLAYGIDTNSIVEILPNGSSYPNMWFAFDGLSSTDTTDSGLTVELTGKSLISWLADGIVYPSTWHSPLTEPTYFNAPVNQGTVTIWTMKDPTGGQKDGTIIGGHSFENATPGNIINTLVARCKERGTLTWLDLDFTGTTTSDSVAWASTLTTSYSTGTTVLAAVQDLANRRLIDFRMNGKTLQLFNYGSLGTKFTADQVTLRRGKHITEQTRNKDASSASSTVLVQAENSILEELADANLATQNGRRRETFVAIAGVTNGPSVQTLGLANLSLSGHVQIEDTIGVADYDLLPWANYKSGDWVWVDFDGTLRNLQIRQIGGSQQESNTLQVGLTLGDLIQEADQKLQQMIDNMTGGVDARGGLPNLNTHQRPSPPSSIVASPQPYRDSNGRDSALVVITWAPPTTRTDGTAITDDLTRYEIQYKLGTSTTWSAAAAIPASTTPLAAYLSNLPVGVSFTCQVRAINTMTNASDWASQVNTVTALPKITTLPSTPSTPTLSPIIKGLKVNWDGLTSTAAIYGAEWARTDIHLSTVAGFTPTSTTLVGSFSTMGGSVSIANLSDANTYYCKLVTYDKSGNGSGASAQSTGASPVRVANADIAPNSITATEIQNQAITGAKVANGAINTNNLTVSAFGDSVAPNGSFEDATSQSTVDTTGAAGWKYFNWPGSASAGSASLSTSGADSTSGSNAVILNVPSGANGGVIGLTIPIPTSNPDVWFVSFKVKANQNLAGAFNVVASMGDTIAEANNLAHSTNGISIAGTLAEAMNNQSVGESALNLTTTYQTWEVGFTVPNNAAGNQYKYVNVMLGIPLGTTLASSLTLYFDQVSVRPVGGNASITNLSASKISAGTLNADLVLGASIKTGDNGARVEVNPDGLFAYDVNENNTVSISSTTGAVSFTGALTATSIGQNSKISNSTITASSFTADPDQGGAVLGYVPATPQVADFKTQGATTWTCPPGVTLAMVECWGGGGGGSRGTQVSAGSAWSGFTSGGHGGGGGEYSQTYVVVSSTGGPAGDGKYNLSVGAGGAGGTNGANGVDSIFTADNHTIAGGTIVAVKAQGGKSGASGGAGGSYNTGDVTFAGKPGASGTTTQTSSANGGKGGNAGQTGATPIGYGGAGGVGNVVGSAGTPYGAGGGGGGGTKSASTTNLGGAGAVGRVKVTFFSSTPVLSTVITSQGGKDQYGNFYSAGASFWGNPQTDWNDPQYPGFFSTTPSGTLNSPPGAGAVYTGFSLGSAVDTSIVQYASRLTLSDAPELWMRCYSQANGWQPWHPVLMGGGPAQGYLGESVSNTAVTFAALGSANRYAGSAKVTFTLSVQRRIKVTTEARYNLGTTASGRMILTPGVNSGSTAIVANNMVDSNNFATIYNDSAVVGANGSTAVSRTGTVLLPAGTYTAYAEIYVNNGGSTSDSASAFHTLVEDIGSK